MTGITVLNGVSSSSFVWDFTYLTIGNFAISVFIKFLNELVNFLLADVETSRFNESSEFSLGHSTIIIEITADESFIEVEARSLGKSLSQAFRVGFNLEVNSPKILEFNFSFTKEAVISLIKSASDIVGCSSV